MTNIKEWLGHTYNGCVRRADDRNSWRYMIADLLPVSRWQLTMMMITVVPREVGDNGYAKFWGVKKIHYGPCENGKLTV